MIQDLRDWLKVVDEAGELQVVRGAHWNLEIGTMCEMWGPDAQALLFDDIVGYPRGMRVLTNALQSPSRITMSLGLPAIRNKIQAARAIRDKIAALKPIPPRIVQDGPVLEVVKQGKDINLLEFPVPHWHELDGGRYIATGSVCITQDPETGWVNFGAYRCQVHNENTTGLAITLGHHGLHIMEKHWARGKPAPMAVACGQDPLLFIVSGMEVPFQVSEYDHAGGYRGAPVDVVRGPYTGLPIPATAELVLEGEYYEQERMPEGPHAEWVGYYASGQQPRHVFHVRSVCHRRDPIILGATPGKPPSDNTYYFSAFRSAAIWDDMEKAGVPGITGVWAHEAGGGRMITTVAIKQLFPGHAKQAGHIAAYCFKGAYANRMVIVVDEDVDCTSLDEVMWAVATRADFRWGLDLSHRNWTSPLDTSCYPPGEEWNVHNSRIIVDACRPWERLKNYPPVAVNGPAIRAQVYEKFKDVFAGKRRVVE